jgi:predicted nucleic acid-binding Zn ribbon protein
VRPARGTSRSSGSAARRRVPRPIGGAVGALADRLAPATVLAEVQRVWAQAVGPTIAAQAEPTAEREGVLTVSCAAAVWAQELDLMGPEIVARINAALCSAADTGARGPVRSLRCQAAPSRAWAREGLS